ncbi:hypothetical protein [Desulfobulbus oralis]|nr:hypothetical protein [Desulfobulbus oralis]
MPAVESGSESYSIDGVNNQLAVRGGAGYTYDAACACSLTGYAASAGMRLGRLKTVRRNGHVVAGYGYDSQNWRVRKSVGTKTTYYLYDLENRLIAALFPDQGRPRLAIFSPPGQSARPVP